MTIGARQLIEWGSVAVDMTIFAGEWGAVCFGFVRAQHKRDG